MSQSATTSEILRELDHRESNGVEVALLWSPRTDRLAVVVSDSAAGESFELPVESSDALEVFHHPYAYAALRGVEYSVGSLA